MNCSILLKFNTEFDHVTADVQGKRVTITARCKVSVLKTLQVRNDGLAEFTW